MKCRWMEYMEIDGWSGPGEASRLVLPHHMVQSYSAALLSRMLNTTSEINVVRRLPSVGPRTGFPRQWVKRNSPWTGPLNLNLSAAHKPLRGDCLWPVEPRLRDVEPPADGTHTGKPYGEVVCVRYPLTWTHAPAAQSAHRCIPRTTTVHDSAKDTAETGFRMYSRIHQTRP